MSGRSALCTGVALAVALVPGAGLAETLPVSGIYPAANDGAATLNTIAVENFSGESGTALSFAITDVLDNAIVGGEPYFQIVPVSDDLIDAVMRGSAGFDTIETELDDREVTKCEKRDKDKKCIKEKITIYECSELEVTFYPHIRLIATDGTEIYAKRDSLTASDSSCENDSSVPSARELLDGLIGSFASRVRYDLAPVFRDQQLRIMESRKGLNKADRRLFREAVKLTKSDIGKSCQEFAALESANSGHVSVLFNMGLCAEGRGDLVAAEAYYERALQVEPGKDYPILGLKRIADRRRADAQLKVHWGE